MIGGSGITQVPNCCSVYILHGLSTSAPFYGTGATYKIQPGKFGQGGYPDNTLIAISMQSQTRAYEKNFRESGFVPVCEFESRYGGTYGTSPLVLWVKAKAGNLKFLNGELK